MAERRVDLHAHTTASDGTLSPTALVELAQRKGLAALAITDHDTLAAIAEARNAGARLGVEIVVGIELSAADETGDVHVLGYDLDPDDATLHAKLAEFRQARQRRGERIIEKLQALGVDVHRDELPNADSIGRPHIARLLLEKRIVTSIQQAFDLWLADGRPAHVPKAKLSAAEAVDLIRRARGVAVLAHPGTLTEPGRYALIRRLAAHGLDGVEVEHPKHDAEERRRLRALCRELGLIETGGSDFHGENKPDIDLGYGRGGNVEVREGVLAAIRSRRAGSSS